MPSSAAERRLWLMFCPATTPMQAERLVRRDFAAALGTYCSASAASRTLALVASELVWFSVLFRT